MCLRHVLAIHIFIIPCSAHASNIKITRNCYKTNFLFFFLFFSDLFHSVESLFFSFVFLFFFYRLDESDVEADITMATNRHDAIVRVFSIETFFFHFIAL